MLFVVYLQQKIIKCNNTMIPKDIRELLLCLLYDEIIVSSWGISDINVTETIVSFYVAGFKYQGKVVIEVKDGSTYEIILDNEKLGCFTIDAIVKTIDERVEKSENCYRDFMKRLRLKS